MWWVNPDVLTVLSWDEIARQITLLNIVTVIIIASLVAFFLVFERLYDQVWPFHRPTKDIFLSRQTRQERLTKRD